MTTQDPTIRGAVIGYGGAFNMGRAHANWMNEAGMQTVAACDQDPARMEAARTDFPGIRTYSDVDALLADPGVNLCVVILPHNLHAEIAVRCARAGKHVIVEKPMCITVAEADAMIEAARAAGVMLTVFHNRRHDGDYMAIRDVVDKGILGDIFHVEAHFGGYGHPGTWWRADRRISGGAMYDWGAHFLDWILNLVPSPVVGVTGFSQKRVWLDVTNEDHVETVLRFANGCSAYLEASSIDRAPGPRWRILGTKGAIVDESREALTVHVGHEGYPATLRVPHLKSDWQAWYDGVAAHLTRGAELEVKPEQARRVIAVLEATQRSAATGETVRPAYP
ncbi:MAG: Gfo/Idh/MocA family oxidoreductase [Chthonomonadales bacterium]|nr:Gfo/Idh/MocA family oxidoreductase [Chthonomonadales bacterium]